MVYNDKMYRIEICDKMNVCISVEEETAECIASDDVKITLESPLCQQEDDDDEMDPYFFDEGYTLAAKTGHSIWGSSLAFLEYLVTERLSSKDGVIRDYLLKGLQTNQVLELGSGTGMTGIGMSRITSSQIICTDIVALVPRITKNIQLNGLSNVVAQPLDWTVDLDKQIKYQVDPREATIIVGTDVTWLKELSVAFIHTLASLLTSTSAKPLLRLPLSTEIYRPKFGIWVYRERGTSDSTIFATYSSLLPVFTAHNLHVEPLCEYSGSRICIIYTLE